MNNSKVLKGLGIVSLGLVAANAAFGILSYNKAKTLKDRKDIVVTYGEETFEMNGKGSRLDCGAMFGSMTLDFRNCQPSEEPLIVDLYARFANVEIIVPEEWYVEAKGKIAMAGIENFTSTYEDEEPSILLNFDAMFAGITVVNEQYT